MTKKKKDKEEKPYFTVQFYLKTQPFQEDIIDKRFEIGRKIYNGMNHVMQNRYKEMVKTKEYRELISSKPATAKERKKRNARLFKIRKDNGFTVNGFRNSKMYLPFKKNIDSNTAQKIDERLWKAYEKYIFDGSCKTVHFQKYGTFNSLEGKTNASGIKIRLKGEVKYGKVNTKDYLDWNGLKVPVIINRKDDYVVQALEHRVVYSRVLRKYVHNKYHYYIQVVFDGLPPVKFNKETGEFKHHMGKGDVGLDIGTQTLAVSSQNSVKMYVLADRVQNIEDQKRILLKKLDRSRRATNPDNYNADGTVKKQGNKKVTWIRSKHYIKYQNQLKELYRKQADIRKLQHECLANEIISLGNNFYIEDMSFKGLQSRSKKTEINDKGRFKRKKRFGKSIANRAPAMLVSIINRKLKYSGNEIHKVNTYKLKASQYNHFEDTYKKKKLSQRWNDFNGIKVQRDLYSAYLLMNVNPDLETYDKQKLNDRFDNFKILHDLEVERLSGNKNLSSIAI